MDAISIARSFQCQSNQSARTRIATLSDPLRPGWGFQVKVISPLEQGLRQI